MIVLAWLTVFALFVMHFNEQQANQYNPNRNAASFQENGEWRLVLKANRMHHYVTNGKINGVPVTFLLDTGATSVAIPANLKRKLALPNGNRGLAYTANGRVEVETTVINELQLGDIRLYNVAATLNPGMNYSTEILLGMNALKQLEVSFGDGELTIVQKP